MTIEQRELHSVLRRFAAEELEPGTRDRDAEARFPDTAWKQCAALGVQGLPVPEEFGGGAADMATTAIAMAGLGEGCSDNGLLFGLNAQMWAVTYPLVRFGTEDQKRRHLPGICDGSTVAAHAASEPEAGSDTFAMQTVARPDGDVYVLDGSKTFVTNGPVADLFLVFATLQPGGGFSRLCAFLVDRDTPGLSVGPPLGKMGLRTSPMSEVHLSGCRVPASCRLGKEGAGAVVFVSAMERERMMILASTVGAMQRQLDRCVRHATTRRQFGQPIGRFQAVAHRLVDMRLRLETSRLLLHHATWAADQGSSLAEVSALVKLHLAEAFVASSQDALQVHGGYGYMTEYDLERDVRDALAARIYSGTSDIQRNIVARALGL